MPTGQSYAARDTWSPLRRSLAGIAETISEQANDLHYSLDCEGFDLKLADTELAHTVAVELSRIGVRMAKLQRRLSAESEREDRQR
jgi:hypothetical protein